MFLSKFFTKAELVFLAAAPAIIAGVYVANSGEHSFFFAWSAGFVGVVIGFLLYTGIKRLLMPARK